MSDTTAQKRNKKELCHVTGMPVYSQVPKHLRPACHDIPEQQMDGRGVTTFTDFGHFVMCFQDMLTCSNNQVEAYFTDYVTHHSPDVVVKVNEVRFFFDDQGTFHGFDTGVNQAVRP